MADDPRSLDARSEPRLFAMHRSALQVIADSHLRAGTPTMI
jgi:hypothetical protein